MHSTLSDKMIRRYREYGYLFPYRGLTAAEAQSYRDAIENYEQTQGGPLAENIATKCTSCLPGLET